MRGGVDTIVPYRTHTCSILRVITRPHIHTHYVGFILPIMNFLCVYPLNMSLIAIPKLVEGVWVFLPNIHLPDNVAPSGHGLMLLEELHKGDLFYFEGRTCLKVCSHLLFELT